MLRHLVVFFWLVIFVALHVGVRSDSEYDYEYAYSYSNEGGGGGGGEDENDDKPKQEWCQEDNCYEILGLDRSADHRMIKVRYNNLSLHYHPDKNPNQTQVDRDRYVKINRAYEILSDSKLRSDYDQYLRVRSSMDSPKEHLVVVLAVLYGVSVLVVLQYQKQYYRNTRKSILDTPSVQQYFEKQYDINLKNPQKSKNKNKSDKKSRKNKTIDANNNESAVSSASSLLTSVDPTIGKDPYEDITDKQINEAIEYLKLIVPEWNSDKPQPDWTDAFWTIPKWLVNTSKSLWFQLGWQYRYNIMKESLSESDREYLCRTHFRLSEEQWNKLNETQKQSYLGQRGKWRKNNKTQNTKKTQ